VLRALVVVDVQNDYFPGGAHPLAEPEAAAANVRRLLDAFRAGGEPLVHVQHVWDAPDAAFMRPGTRGVEIHDMVAPLAGEKVVRKTHPNSFLETSLADTLRLAGADHVVVCGMLTSMCVDATARAASDLGFGVTIVADACATCDLEFEGEAIPARQIHGGFLAALRDGYGAVATTDELLSTS